MGVKPIEPIEPGKDQITPQDSKIEELDLKIDKTLETKADAQCPLRPSKEGKCPLRASVKEKEII